MIILPYGIYWSTLNTLHSFMWILKLNFSLMQMFLENHHADSAPAPSIQTLPEGLLTERRWVTFTCRAMAPCPTEPPHLSWNQSGGPEGRVEPHRDREPNVRTRRLNITLSDRHDGVSLTCLAEYPRNHSAGGPRTAESVVTLNVSCEWPADGPISEPGRLRSRKTLQTAFKSINSTTIAWNWRLILCSCRFPEGYPGLRQPPHGVAGHCGQPDVHQQSQPPRSPVHLVQEQCGGTPEPVRWIFVQL